MEGFPGLKSGIRMASFHCLGHCEVYHIILKMISKYLRIFIGKCLMTVLLIPSLPGEVHLAESMAWFNCSILKGSLITLSLLLSMQKSFSALSLIGIKEGL